MPKSSATSVPDYPIERRIHMVRGQKIMLDSDLAELYGVQTKRLNEAVKRNAERFPGTFMFRLTDAEAAAMRSQFATSSKRKIRYQPLAFTEHGVVMLSAVLNSPRAIQMSIMVVQAFVRLRQIIAANKDLAVRVDKLEAGHRQVSSILQMLIDEIEQMKAIPPPSDRKMGFDL
jgi:hypothetical protein